MSLQYDRDRREFFERCQRNQSFPSNDALKLIVLEEILDEFETGRTYSKSDVNEKIESHFDDFVMIRRELVNFQYLEYDHRGNEYTVVRRQLSEEDVRAISRLERHAKDIGLLD